MTTAVSHEILTGARKRRRSTVPGSPRAVLRLAVEAGVVATHEARVVRLAARIARAPSRVVAAWQACEDADGAGDALEAVGRWHVAVDETRSWLHPTPAGKVRDPEQAVRRAAAAAARCGVCGVTFSEAGREQVQLFPQLCNTRCCLTCMRRRLRGVTDRWAPLYAAPLRDGYQLSFVTIGSVGGVESRADVRGYLRRLGRLCRAMRDGAPSYGIPARSWVAGVRALEVVPRPRGGFNHAHLAVVRRAFYPYGLAAGKLPADPSPSQLGLRGLLRSLGMGEVFQDERVTSSADGESPIGLYQSKVEKYMGKVERDGEDGDGAAAPWAGREDLQRAMRGVRLLQPFGDALGLLGGPNRTTRYRDGRPLGLLTRRGVYDPEDADTWPRVPEAVRGLYLNEMPLECKGDADTIETRTWYREDTLQSWRGWCDVDALRAGLFG